MDFTFPQFMRTSEAQAILKQAKDTEIATRRPLVRELEEYTARKPVLTARQRKELSPLERTLDTARQRYLAAEQAVRESRATAFAETHAIDQRIAHLESQLRATADPAIAAARSRLEAQFDRERHTAGRHEEIADPNGKRDAATLKPVMIRRGNGLAFGRLVAAIRNARASFAALELSAADDVAAEIASIEARLAAAYAGLDELDPIPA
jgi:hypothetical protein